MRFIDASPLAIEIAHLLTANPEFYNLPRKFKISATGCPSWCTYPEINDIGLTPVKHNGQVGLLAARRRRPLQRAASRRSPRRVRSARSGRRRRHGDHRNLPRPAGPAREPRPRPAQVPLHERRLDRRTASSPNFSRASISRCCPASPRKCPTRRFAITSAFIRSASPA